jgi:hypothetical protein
VSLRRTALIAVLAGVIAGVIVAKAVPDHRSVAATAPPQPPLRFEPARHSRAYERHGPARTVARAKDPDGGPDWALRVFDSGMSFPGPAGDLFARSCVQLGRIARGQFGWIDSANVFRPIRANQSDAAPTDCGRAYLRAPEFPRLGIVTLTSDLRRTPVRLTRSVVWGVGPQGSTSARLKVGTHAESPPVSRDGAFIAFEPADTSRQSVSASFDGGTELSLSQAYNGKYRPPPFPERPLPVIGARAPDPNGGLPWGIGVVPSDHGGLCLSGGPLRVIGDRVGTIDFRLGLFDDENTLRYVCNAEQILTRKYLVALETNYSTDSSGGQQPGDDPAPGRIARRTQKGYSVIAGRTRADVVAITIANPAGVRTLTPSGPAHAFVAVYPGSFKGGTTTFTARFRDGHTQVVKSPRF